MWKLALVPLFIQRDLTYFVSNKKLPQCLGPPSPLWESFIIISMTREIYIKLKAGWIKAKSSINSRIPFPLILKNDWRGVKDRLVKTISAISLNCWDTKLGSFTFLWPGIKYLLFCQICSAGNKIVEVSSDLHQCDCDLYYYQDSVFILLCFCNSHWRASVWGTVNSTCFEKLFTFLHLKYWWLFKAGIIAYRISWKYCKTAHAQNCLKSYSR